MRRSTRPGATARRTGCGSSRTTRAPTTASTTSSRIRRSGSCSTTCGGSPYEPDIDVAFRDAWFNGYVPVNEGFASAIVAELEREPGRRGLPARLPPVPRAEARPRARPDALLTHFIHIPWPETDYWHVLPARPARRDPRGRARERHPRLAHESLAAQLPWRVRGHPRRRRRSRGVDGRRTTGGRRSSRVIRSASTRPSSRSSRDAPNVLEQERAIVAARPEFLVVRVDRTDPSKNIVRGFRAFALFLEQHPELHGRVAMLALLDPSRQDIPQYTEYLAAVEREARVVNERFAARRLAAGRPADRRQLRAVDRGVQAVRRAARQSGLRRDESRVEGGAARERARRRADPLRERRLARGARRVGAHGQSVRHRRPGGGDPRGADDGGRRAAAAARGDPRAASREHDLAAWIAAQLADLDRVAATGRTIPAR